MNTSQHIEQQIDSDRDKFYNSIYNGKVAVPDDIVEKLKIAAMGLPPQFHQVHISKIKVMASKQPSELTNTDLADIIKMIVNCPLEKFYYDFDEAIEGHIRFEKFVLSFNIYVNEFKSNLEIKKASLITLSGTKANGLRGIIT